jgi:hypothetical protein
MNKIKEYFTIGFGLSLGIGVALSLCFSFWVVAIFTLDTLINISSSAYCSPSSRYCDVTNTTALLLLMQTLFLAGFIYLLAKLVALKNNQKT